MLTTKIKYFWRSHIRKQNKLSLYKMNNCQRNIKYHTANLNNFYTVYMKYEHALILHTKKYTNRNCLISCYKFNKSGNTCHNKISHVSHSWVISYVVIISCSLSHN